METSSESAVQQAPHRWWEFPNREEVFLIAIKYRRVLLGLLVAGLFLLAEERLRVMDHRFFQPSYQGVLGLAHYQLGHYAQAARAYRADLRTGGWRERDRGDKAYSALLQGDLREVGEAALQSLWTCQVEELIAKNSPIEHLPIDLEAAFNASQGLDGRALVRLASITLQVINGQFEARDLHFARPWIRLTAVDSSYWDVWAETEKALGPLLARFKNVERVDDA